MPADRLQQVVDRLYIEGGERCLSYPAGLIGDDKDSLEATQDDVRYLLQRLRKAGVKVPKRSASIKAD